MFHWLSSYNYDFALATIPIQIIMLIFYSSRRNLPVRASNSFLFLMIANFLMTCFDLISCELNEVWTSNNIVLLYYVNMMYFLMFIARGWLLFDYTAEVCHAYSLFGKHVRIVCALPAIIVSLMILSTPWTKAIFYISSTQGYYNTSLYQAIYVNTYLYIGLSLLCIVLRWKHMDIRLKISMLAYNAILIAGIMLRSLFINTLVTSYFSILAIIVIYLSIQNPDLFRERKTRLFNSAAADKISKEYYFRGIPFHIVTLNVQKYEALKVLYGNRQLHKALSKMGQWILESFPEYFIFYLGNGEFIMLSKGKVEGRQSEIIDKLYEYFEFPWEDEETNIDMEMSVVLIPYEMLKDRGERLDDMIRYAIANAYVHNKSGKVAFDEAMLNDMVRIEAVERAIGRALEKNSVEVYFQPIYSVKKRAITSAEALARLTDSEIGPIPPDEFIRVAEQTGDIMELGRQIFDKVCDFIRTENIRQYGIERINVNLSPAQCMNAQLAGILAETAEHHGVSFEQIDFEITETFVEDKNTMQNLMLGMQKYGAEFSLDDFGTGTSNITRLLQLPIHVVKLDMHVVWSYFRGESNLLPDLVKMFQNADLQIIAEGIETEEMKDGIASMGCDYEQGYYFSKPMPRDEFIEYLKNNKGRAS